jgi:AcrR family transcriptional regulator
MNDKAESDTKTRILDSAESLFAEHGFEGTSLRQITAAAGVNLASVNYHFHSKEELIRAVFARRVQPINRERLRRLTELEAAGGDEPLLLEPLVEAFYAPVLELNRDEKNRFQPLIGRMYGETGIVREMFMQQMGEVARRFSIALRRALPELPAVELVWRMHFVIGALAHTMAASQMLEMLSGGACDLRDAEAVTRRLVQFACAGLRAPLNG